MSQLISIVYKPKSAQPEGGAYTRVPITHAVLVAGHGIEGDEKGGSGNRHLNIMSAHTMQDLTVEGFQTCPGRMGEQLIVGDLDVNALPPGTRLQIGEQSIVELTEPRTGCAKLERHQGKQRQDASGRLGMMARVLVGGNISIGDVVSALDSDG